MILNTDKHPVMSVAQVRTEIEQGRAGAVGEITAQYAGLNPSDPILEPYWALAETIDIPVMIHTGTSFPGTAYAGYPELSAATRQSAAAGGRAGKTSEATSVDCA